MIAAALAWATLLKRFWKAAAIGLLLLALAIQTHRIGTLERDHARQIAQAEKARADAVAKTIIIERDSARITAEREQAHEKTLVDLRDAAARRLRALTGKPGPVPRLPETPFHADAGAGRDRLCIETPFAVALMLAADENTRQLIDLQTWIRAQEEMIR